MANAIIVTGHLVVSRSGKVRWNKSKPSLESDEVAIRIGIQVPTALFDRPVISANIIVDSKDVPTHEIRPEIIASMKNIIESETGVKVELKVLPAKEASQ